MFEMQGPTFEMKSVALSFVIILCTLCHQVLLVHVHQVEVSGVQPDNILEPGTVLLVDPVPHFFQRCEDTIDIQGPTFEMKSVALSFVIILCTLCHQVLLVHVHQVEVSGVQPDNILEPGTVLLVDPVPHFFQRCEDTIDIPYCVHIIICLCLEATSEGSQVPPNTCW